MSAEDCDRAMAFSADDMASLRSMRDQWRTNLFGSVMPFWMRHSIDAEHGGFFTCLDNDGSIYDDTKYTWLQGREVYTLSRLYNEVPVGSDSGMVDAATRNRWLAAAARGPVPDDIITHLDYLDEGVLIMQPVNNGGHQQKKPPPILLENSAYSK